MLNSVGYRPTSADLSYAITEEVGIRWTVGATISGPVTLFIPREMGTEEFDH